MSTTVRREPQRALRRALNTHVSDLLLVAAGRAGERCEVESGTLSGSAASSRFPRDRLARLALVIGFAQLSLATLHARHPDGRTALRHYAKTIPEWDRTGA